MMRHRDLTRDDVPALVELAMARCPHLQAWWVTGLFSEGVDVDVARVVESPEGVPVAFGAVTHRHGRPDRQRWVNVFVGQDVEGAGVATELLDDCLARVAPGATELWAQVFDDDERSMAVAGHWGFETVQLSITSVAEIDPATAPPPDLPDGVTAEPCGDLDPPDADAFDAMLTASQTNPEARTSHVITRDEMRGWVDEGELPLGALVRVDGVPAAVSFGGVVPADGIGGLGYTGVDPRFRGRGLGRLVKEHLHHQAAQLGVRRLYTDNEENNHGIRRVNAAMGYVPDYGLFRLRKHLGER